LNVVVGGGVRVLQESDVIAYPKVTRTRRFIARQRSEAMLVLYDPATSKKMNRNCWGSDPDRIRYADVSSCLSVTLVYDGALAGAHFGLYEGENFTPLTTVNLALMRMIGCAPKNAQVRRALLIGNTGTWLGANPVVYKYIKKFCVFVDPKYAHEEKWETPETPAQCDIIVHRTGQVFFTYTVHSRKAASGPFREESFELH
jgi:hypothetical protein